MKVVVVWKEHIFRILIFDCRYITQQMPLSDMATILISDSAFPQIEMGHRSTGSGRVLVSWVTNPLAQEGFLVIWVTNRPFTR